MIKSSSGKNVPHCQSCIEKEFPIYDVTGTHYSNGVLDGLFTDVAIVGNVQIDPIDGLQYSDGKEWNSYPSSNYTNVDIKLYDNGCDSYIAMICQKNQNLETKIGDVTLQPCGLRELLSADSEGNLSLIKSTLDIKLPKCGSCIEQECKIPYTINYQADYSYQNDNYNDDRNGYGNNGNHYGYGNDGSNGNNGNHYAYGHNGNNGNHYGYGH